MWYPISEFIDLAGCIQMTQDNGVDLFKQQCNFSIMDWFLQHGAHYPDSAPMVVLLKCFPLSQFPSSWIITNYTADNSFSEYWFDLGYWFNWNKTYFTADTFSTARKKLFFPPLEDLYEWICGDFVSSHQKLMSITFKQRQARWKWTN